MAKYPELKSFDDDLTKRWFIRFSIRDPKDGKLKRIKKYGDINQALTVKGRYKAARRLIQEYTAKIKNGWNYYVEQEQIYQHQHSFDNSEYIEQRLANKTFNDYAMVWLERKMNIESIQKKTLQSYTSPIIHINKWLDDKGAKDNDITCFSNAMAIEFIRYAIDEREYSKQTLKRYKRLMNNIFDYAIKDGADMKNPMYDLPELKMNESSASIPITDEDIDKFKHAIAMEDPQLWLAIKFIYYCFLRPGKELRLLQVKHINLSRGFIDIDEFRAKTNEARKIDIPNSLLSELVALGIDKLPNDYYVIGKYAEPGKEHTAINNLYKRFVRFRDRLNLNSRYTLYSWKHTGNSRAVDAGISLEELKNQNGHKTITTTEVYIKDKIGKPNQHIRSNFPKV